LGPPDHAADAAVAATSRHEHALRRWADRRRCQRCRSLSPPFLGVAVLPHDWSCVDGATSFRHRISCSPRCALAAAATARMHPRAWRSAVIKFPRGFGGVERARCVLFGDVFCGGRRRLVGPRCMPRRSRTAARHRWPTERTFFFSCFLLSSAILYVGGVISEGIEG